MTMLKRSLQILLFVIYFVKLLNSQCISFVAPNGANGLPCGQSEQVPCKTFALSYSSCINNNEITINIAPGTYLITETSYNVTNKNITIQKTPSSSIGSNVTLTITKNSPFLSIFYVNVGDKTTITIDSILFTASSNNAIAFGSVVFNKGALVDVIISNCQFENFVASSGGGVIAMLPSDVSGSTVTVFNTIIQGAECSSTIGGGFIFSNSTATINITQTTVNGPYGNSLGTFLYVQAGHVYLDHVTIDGSDSLNGAIVVNTNIFITTVSNFKFSNLKLINSKGGYGIVYIMQNQGLREILESEFSNNVNTIPIYTQISSKLSITNSKFFKNSKDTNSLYVVSGILNYNSPLSIDSTTFKSNLGYSVYLNYTTVGPDSYGATIVNSIFEDNDYSSIYSSKGYLNVNNLTFTNNQALIGPSIYCELSNITLNNIEYSGNSQETIDSFNPVVSCTSNLKCSISSNTKELKESCEPNPDANTNEGSKLSKGEIAGIVIGVIAGVVIFILLCVILVKTKGKCCIPGDD